MEHIGVLLLVFGYLIPVVNRRRVISPVSEANTDVHEFFTMFLRPDY